jgi:16S rRNA (cytidine1402-2'-O)-methyltransferase
MSFVFVPTPLGNLRDITLRAIDVIRSCDLIAAEDTRVTRRLLSAYEITGKTIVRHDQYSSPATIDMLIERAANACVAVMTDAGMPGISDPGHALIARARECGIPIDVLPGGSAFVCAAILSGFPPTPLLFDGFLPRTLQARRIAIQNALQRETTVVWYESPHRLISSLELLAHEAPNARVFIGRELTKKFEQHLSGNAAQVLAALSTPIKGEITLVVYPSKPIHAPLIAAQDETTLENQIDALLLAGKSIAYIAKTLSQNGENRQKIYMLASNRQRKNND